MYLSYAHTTRHLQVDGDRLNRFFQAGIFVVLFLILLYAVEKNSVLSVEREISQKQARIVSAEEDLSKLEVKAAQLESSYNIRSSALSANMVPSDKMRFVSVDDTAVSMK